LVIGDWALLEILIGENDNFCEVRRDVTKSPLLVFKLDLPGSSISLEFETLRLFVSIFGALPTDTMSLYPLALSKGEGEYSSSSEPIIEVAAALGAIFRAVPIETVSLYPLALSRGEGAYPSSSELRTPRMLQMSYR
jgi:hypothetical protein